MTDYIKTTIQEIYEKPGDKEAGVPPLFTVQSTIENLDTKRVKSITSIQVDYVLQPSEDKE